MQGALVAQLPFDADQCIHFRDGQVLEQLELPFRENVRLQQLRSHELLDELG